MGSNQSKSENQKNYLAFTVIPCDGKCLNNQVVQSHGYSQYGATGTAGAGSSPGACADVVQERLESVSTTGFSLINMKRLTFTRTARKLPPVQTGTTRSSKLLLNCSGSNRSQCASARAGVGCGGLQNTVGQKA